MGANGWRDVRGRIPDAMAAGGAALPNWLACSGGQPALDTASQPSRLVSPHVLGANRHAAPRPFTSSGVRCRSCLSVLADFLGRAALCRACARNAHAGRAVCIHGDDDVPSVPRAAEEASVCMGTPTPSAAAADAGPSGAARFNSSRQDTTHVGGGGLTKGIRPGLMPFVTFRLRSSSSWAR